jgi:hypothetical protein
VIIEGLGLNAQRVLPNAAGGRRSGSRYLRGKPATYVLEDEREISNHLPCQEYASQTRLILSRTWRHRRHELGLKLKEDTGILHAFD